MFAGKKVLVQVFGLTDRTEGESPEEAYVHGILNEKLLQQDWKWTIEVQ